MTDATHGNGLLIVVSAPSGGGKGTILERAFAEDDRLAQTVSVTTRSPRSTETHGKDYYFVNPATFEQWVSEGKFVEHAVVHGQRKGTLCSELEQLRRADRDVVLELDVQGMRALKAQYPEAVTVFIEPPSLEELENQLRKRGDLTPDQFRVRLENAQAEMAAKNEYDHVILNDTVDQAVAAFHRILEAERARAATG